MLVRLGYKKIWQFFGVFTPGNRTNRGWLAQWEEVTLIEKWHAFGPEEPKYCAKGTILENFSQFLPSIRYCGIFGDISAKFDTSPDPDIVFVISCQLNKSFNLIKRVFIPILWNFNYIPNVSYILCRFLFYDLNGSRIYFHKFTY